MSRTARSFTLLLTVALAGCGAASTPELRSAPPHERAVIRSEPTPLAPSGIQLGLRTTDRQWIELSELRGRCTLLFLFATFDAASQASLRPLTAFVEAHPEIPVIAIAVEPSPRELADAWQRALSPPFPVAYDPTGAVLEGSSPLGRILSVPRLRLLDAGGRLVAEHVGYPSHGVLPELLHATRCPAAPEL